ncbi:helix-turn-helix DNA binding domain protein [Streptomyces phage TG1]|uniref:Helix-turn-helix DNA binding domain protein n=1 Tax=Streptomyces phage TG1 TaxID=2927987 RepID=K4IBS0_9CAUD|nr:helix-turn-helix DNA binding domain protein [Streptomyces phage TG1]AFU62249.1 helix-turn-helix DNA binding domain protein [Streptomyces phage TG1]
MKLDRTKPAWPQIAAEIERRIDSGEYAPGMRLPGAVPLSAEFGVASSTAARAVRHLVSKGRLVASVGWGTFVPETQDAPATDHEGQ